MKEKAFSFFTSVVSFPFSFLFLSEMNKTLKNSILVSFSALKKKKKLFPFKTRGKKEKRRASKHQQNKAVKLGLGSQLEIEVESVLWELI